MFNNNLVTLTLIAAIGSGLVAGVFFAFSTLVMPALARIEPVQGIAAMQSINITAINPLFMLALFGTAVVCFFLAILTALKWGQPHSAYLLIGSLFYLIGVIGVTIAFNVPLNDALASVKPGSPEGATLWSKYLTNWTLWNHVRTIASLIATLLFTIALGK
ncbi:anthrone oxygenase family protein [Leptolyngbya sp. NIES-2104]|uniref:anthrone oxygenase family protein n=1 Tax=Leptolyngbya sp. NIES-2104 TaxID=1552121 RepID=UPI0006ECA0C1|nr:anthrone oxygenase family protein [Leptolyngbya sp. NIES-2104]GAP99648.1 integral membrane protein [Leptolyngbya sp. NIES-2104]